MIIFISTKRTIVLIFRNA